MSKVLATSNAHSSEGQESEERRLSNSAVAKKRRHSVLMDTSVKNFQRLLNSAGEFMRDEVENLPLRIYE